MRESQGVHREARPHAARAIECLEGAGIRATTERVDALALLMRNMGRVHTVRELLSQDPGDAGAGAASTRLYRAMHALEEKGIVAREVLEVRGRAVFGFRMGEPAAPAEPAVPRDRIRFQCRQCGQVAQDSSPALHARLAALGLSHGVSPTPSDVVVLYTCGVCGGQQARQST